MKFSRHYALLLLIMTIVSLTIAIPTVYSVQAAPLGQSAEDQIRATLEEANQLLGGGFKWESVDTDSNTIASYYMSRPPPPGQEYNDLVDLPLLLDEVLWIRIVVESPCQYYTIMNPWTFHGMEGCFDAGETTGWITSVFWQPQDGLTVNGYGIALSTFSIGETQGTQGAVVLAEALHQAATNNGLYGSMEGEYLPANPTEAYSNLSEDFLETTDSEQLFDIPLAVVLGSLGIPVAGALAGAVLSAILSGSSAVASSTAGSTAATAIPTPASSGIPTAGGEGIPSTGGEGPTAGGEGIPSAGAEGIPSTGGEGSTAGGESPTTVDEGKTVEDQISAAKFDFLTHDLESINQDLVDKNIYVLNPHQGDPTLIVHRVNTGFNMVWDKTVGQLTGSQGLTCEGYIDKTKDKVYTAVSKRFPGSTLQRIKFEEKSTLKENKSWGEWLDSRNDDNHILYKLILPDGSEWSVDFHQYNAGNAPLVQSWSKTHRSWKKYMGEEFSDYINHTQKVINKK